ncbi:hypothetical protein G9A89_001381 [Geosiphon pyriformis]|nr:hypothetical protein G9A89_001381 [Geosiphon pyriformis]
MTTTNRYFPFLSRDFSKLLESAQNPDICVKVGRGNLTRSFRSHSLILHARSNLFAKLLADKTTFSPSEGEDLEPKLPVVSGQKLELLTPAVFEILLRYIYGGSLPLENRCGRHILDLLVGADLLELPEILIEIQDHLIKNNGDWLVENFGLISRTIMEHPNFKPLYESYKDIIRTRPEGIFQAKDFLIIPQSTLIEILKNDDVAMEEVDIWKRVIEWGNGQTPNQNRNTASWSLLEFARLQKNLENCIPHIRFFQLSSSEFQDHVFPYLEILGNQLSTDILSYHLKPGYIPKTPVAPPRYGTKSMMIAKMVPHYHFDSITINKRHAALISIWLRRKENETPSKFRSQEPAIENSLEFKLLLRGSRDGFTPKEFHRLCDSKGATLTVIKVRGTGEILGGYNPLDWKATDEGKYQETKDSFIFSLGENFPKSAILSRVAESTQAIYYNKVWGPSFGVFDLALHGNFSGDGLCRSLKGQYENELRPRECEDFSVEEYEVFQVIDHEQFKEERGEIVKEIRILTEEKQTAFKILPP